jgi:general stress protein 26
MDARPIDRVWHIVEKVGVAMLTTRFAGGLRARPLEARPDRAAGLIWFLTDMRSGKDGEVATSPDVGLVFIDAGDKAYLSITGRAEILRDTAQAAKIWKSTDQVWWPGGPDDPTLRLLRVEPKTAELWDGPSSRGRRGFRIRQGKTHGRQAKSGREPQDQRADAINACQPLNHRRGCASACHACSREAVPTPDSRPGAGTARAREPTSRSPAPRSSSPGRT